MTLSRRHLFGLLAGAAAAPMAVVAGPVDADAAYLAKLRIMLDQVAGPEVAMWTTWARVRPTTPDDFVILNAPMGASWGEDVRKAARP